jgi:hypothetical protein
MKYAQRTEVPNASHLYEDSQFVPLTVSHQHTLVYPYISNVEERQTKTEGSGTVTQINFIYLVVPSKIEIYKRDRYGNFIEGTSKSFDIIDTDKIHIYRYEDMQDDPMVVTKSIPRTIKKRIYVGYAYFDVYNASLENTEETKNETKDVIESYIELWGLFGTFDRYGGFQFIDLTKKLQLYPSDTLYPAENLYPRAQRNLITQSMYSKVEYEDVPTRHYDKIECTWRDSNNVEHSCSYQIVDPDSLEWYDPDDYQQYNLSDNYFIKNGYFTEEEVQTILEILGEKIKDFQYYPANIEMRGLPYLEAGDELAVVTRMSGFTTFILRRTMNGIQELKDNIEAEM